MSIPVLRSLRWTETNLKVDDDIDAYSLLTQKRIQIILDMNSTTE